MIQQDLTSETFWRLIAPRLSIRSGMLPAPAAAPDEGTLEALVHAMGREGYCKGHESRLAELAGALAETADILAARSIPIPFLFVYDEAWASFQLLHPVISRLLGGAYCALPCFWAWHVAPGQSGWPPHRDRGKSSLAADGRPLSITLWIPLTDATEANGCIHVVPTRLDPDHAVPVEEAPGLGRPLPASPGDWLAWNHAVVHYGGRAREGERPRVSLSMEFQSEAVAPFNEPLLWPLENPLFQHRILLIAMQLLQYEHVAPLNPEWRAFAEQQTMPLRSVGRHDE